MNERPTGSPQTSSGGLRRFLSTEAAGGVLLLAATAVALAVANSPLRDPFERLLSSSTALEFGPLRLPGDLHVWINEGLMTIFFLVVGLEIKREVVDGELKGRQKAVLPVIAALGGMVVPAAIYLAFTADAEVSRGWGIPMATDIAFAVGILALLGPRVPTAMKVFMLAVAIADDIGAVVVIALFYAAAISIPWLLITGALLIVFRRVATMVGDPSSSSVRVALLTIAVAVWLTTLRTGIHPSLAGVALAFLLPTGGGAPSRLGDLEDGLHPWSSFVVLPLFALANAGVSLGGALDSIRSPVAMAVALGLVAGKFIGVTAFVWAAVKLGVGVLPEGLTWPHVFSLALLSGIGFTVSLFMTSVAFDAPDLVLQAKLGVLVGSVTAALAGSAASALACRAERR